MPVSSRALALILFTSSLGGCQMLGGSSGVMPDSDVGPPPSMQGKVPGSRPMRSSNVDEDGQPLPSGPTRQLALPKTLGNTARSADAGARKIDRDDLEGAGSARGGGSSGMSPSLTPNGGIGMGGKF